MAAREMLRQNLVQLLETARRDCQVFFREHGLSFGFPIQRPVVIDNEDGSGWRIEYEKIEANSFEQYLTSWPKFSDSTIHAILDLSADFLAEFATTLPCWANPFYGESERLLGQSEMQPDFKSEPNFWVALKIITPAILDYLRSLDSVKSPDEPLATRIANDAVELAGASKLKSISYVPVFGITSEVEDVISGDIAVRKLTPYQRGEIWNTAAASAYRQSRDMLYSGRMPSVLPNHVIEITTTGPRMEQPGLKTSPQAALCAFYLHGYPLAGLGMLTLTAAPGWFSFGRMGMPVPLRAQQDGVKELDQNSLDEIWRTFKKLRSFNFEQPSSPRDLALHRFLLGSTRESYVDSLLDYTIALECILLPYDPATRHGDLAYRFRLHGGHYIAATKSERREVWKQLRDIYDMRSRLVHGADYPTVSEVKASLDPVRSLAGRALLKAVSSHFPRVEEFNNLALGDV